MQHAQVSIQTHISTTLHMPDMLQYEPSIINPIQAPVYDKQTTSSFSYQKQNNPIVPIHRTELGKKCEAHMGPIIWNKIPENIKQTKTLTRGPRTTELNYPYQVVSEF